MSAFTGGGETWTGTDNTDGIVNNSNIPATTLTSALNFLDAFVSGENLWDRNGSVLSPHNSGDDVSIGTGKLKDVNASAGVTLGATGENTLQTSAQSIIGAINEVKNMTSVAAIWTSASGNLYPTTLTNKVGIGTNNPVAKLHIFTGSASANTPLANTIVAIENSADAYISFRTPTNRTAGLVFGNGNRNNEGLLTYNNQSHLMNLQVSSRPLMTFAQNVIHFNVDNVDCAVNFYDNGARSTLFVAASGAVDGGGAVGIGFSSPRSTLHLNGSFAQRIAYVTTTYDVRNDDGIVLVDSSVICTVNLASAAISERQVVIKNRGLGPVLLQSSGATFDGQPTLTITNQFESRRLAFDTNVTPTWNII